MANGVPLTDNDRWTWLIALRKQCVAALATDGPGVVLTCSALKRSYRDLIRVASTEDSNIRVHFVYLRTTEELSLSRVKARAGHYMKVDMVKSQFQTLEEPTANEKDCLIVDVGGTMLEVQDLALTAVKGALQKVVEATHTVS